MGKLANPNVKLSAYLKHLHQKIRFTKVNGDCYVTRRWLLRFAPVNEQTKLLAVEQQIWLLKMRFGGWRQECEDCGQEQQRRDDNRSTGN